MTNIHTAGFRLVFASVVILADIFLAHGGATNLGWVSLGGMGVVWCLAWFDHDANPE